jgi:hypothetical protein
MERHLQAPSASYGVEYEHRDSLQIMAILLYKNKIKRNVPVFNAMKAYGIVEV